MQCCQVGKTAFRPMRPACATRAAEADEGTSSRGEQVGGGELPTSFAEMAIELVPLSQADLPGETA